MTDNRDVARVVLGVLTILALPLVGPKIGDVWDRLAASGMKSLVAQLGPLPVLLPVG